MDTKNHTNDKHKRSLLKYAVALSCVIFILVIFYKSNDDQKIIVSEVNQEKNINEDTATETSEELSNEGQVEEITSDQMVFIEDFSGNEIVEEVGDMSESLDDSWWLNSGAYLFRENGVGRTIFGKLEKGSKWQKRFSKGKRDIPEESDNGYRPQNIFRLVTKTKWENFSQEALYNINKYNLSKSKHRRQSNGLLLFNRYQDGNNLYYTGIRVDGTVTIKKKYKGTYYTMASNVVIPGKYDRKKNPNLLPINEWIGVRSVVQTEGKEVSVRLYIKMNRADEWRLVAEAVDNMSNYGGNPIFEEGYAGIRTDFMDVEFDNYRIEEVVL